MISSPSNPSQKIAAAPSASTSSTLSFGSARPPTRDRLVHRPGLRLRLLLRSSAAKTFCRAGGAASWLNVASELGIIALPIGLLMIAGQLDISVGSMIPAGAMTVAIISGYYRRADHRRHRSRRSAFGLIVGLINGILVVRTKVPSFVVTLGTLFAVAGLILGLSVILTGSTSVALTAPARAKFLFGGFIGGKFQVTIFWWIAVVAIFGFVMNFSPLRQLDLRHGRRQA